MLGSSKQPLPEESTSGKILLTADRTLMSDYHKNIFIGFGTCAPPNFLPNWLYGWLFFPPIKTKNGIPVAAPYGLRKIETQLQSEGFDVLTVSPNHLKKHIDGAKVLGIHVMDPFGLGPASTTFAFILKKEPYLAQYFHALLASPEIQRAKKRGLKIIVGGQGVWQFLYRQKFVERYGIDCIIAGEAEKVVGDIFRAALKDEPLPKYYEVPAKDSPSLEEIPDITKPSIDGLVEIGRGCCRGCQFCSVTVRPLRWHPIEKILREIDVNMDSGYYRSVNLHAEDAMLYGSKNTIPNDEKLKKLHEAVVKKCDGMGWSHCSLAAVAAKPKLLKEISDIILQKQSWWGAEVGIETGSGELAKKMMPAKAHPFKAEEWPEVVRNGMGLMHDNKLVPACTLIVGSPEETEDDLIKTIELMDDLKGVRSLIVPLFFVPMGKLKSEDWFKEAQMTKLHQELLVKCLNHGLYWVDELIDMAFTQRWRAQIVRQFYRFFARIVRYRVKRAGIVGEADN
jgi:radical SAM superfamily enzyme YgiQ (UPF0313 family)